MNKSYEQVNYLLRTKKQIERKCIIEALQSLAPLVEISKYNYLGFGSVYYADFILFHKYLNISNMTSIDDEKSDEKRFKFNKPYEFIEFISIDSNQYLTSRIDWKKNHLLWFDYDGVVNLSVLDDLRLVASQAKPLNIFIATIKADRPKSPTDIIQEFKNHLKPGLTPAIVKKDWIKLLREMMHEAINVGLNSRTDDLKFLQLFNLSYKDTSSMYTFGGILYENQDSENIKNYVQDLNFVSHNSKLVSIDCPILSPKEKMYLDHFIDENIAIKNNRASRIGISADKVNRYLKYYKYYPQYFESVY